MIRNLRLPLNINIRALEKYSVLAANIIPQDFPERYNFIYEGFRQSLCSKQCNEPYERMISECLGLVNLGTKHGWDALDRLEDPSEVYEYKPSSQKPYSPSGTINDDSLAKIEKCERLFGEGKKGWLVLVGVNKTTYTLDCIYKFPLHIYTEDRRSRLVDLIKSNKNKDKYLTRSMYPIHVKSSVEFCEMLGEEYYVWTRTPVQD